MEINSKKLFAIAAIGAVAWYMLRKGSTNPAAAVTPAATPARPSAGIWDGFGVGADLYAALNQTPATTGSTKPEQIKPETGTTKPEPYTAPATGGGGAVFGASGGGGAQFLGIQNGRRVWSDGSSSALTENELDLYQRGILGKPYIATHNAGAAAPAPASGGSGAVWGAPG